MSKKHVHVSIALIRQAGNILLGWRDESLPQGGCYEFPGGKIEQGESPEQALQREVLEEVGISIQVIKRFEQIYFDYSERTVTLHVYLCQPLSQDINAQWAWVALDRLHSFRFPDANQSIVQRLSWTRRLAITTATQSVLKLKSDIKLCYLRDRTQLAQDISELDTQQIASIVTLSDYLQLNEQMQQKVFAIHLKSQELQRIDSLAAYENKNFIAACHHTRDIEKANLLGCDAILLSPVQMTSTHPEVRALGWENFAELVQKAEMPVYALGGMRQIDLAQAQQYGAYGIAGISDFWQA